MPMNKQKRGGTNANTTTNNKLSSVMNNASNKVSNIKEKVNGVTNGVSEKLNIVKEKVKTTTNNIGNKFNDVKQKATNSTSALKNSVQGSNTFGVAQNQVGKLNEMTQDFAEKNSFIAKIIFIVFVFIVFGLLFRLGIYLLSLFYAPNKNPIVVNGMRDLKKSKIYNVNPNEQDPKPILRSINENQGMEFSWSTWIWLEGGVSANNTSEYIFSKGKDINNEKLKLNTTTSEEEKMVSPGLFLSDDLSGSNTLKVVLTTYGLAEQSAGSYNMYGDAAITKTIEIPNIPLQKWVNVIIRVQGKIVDIYINGTLTKRQEFEAVIRQNYGDVYVGSQQNGAEGYISNLRYYNHAIGSYTIQDIMYYGPNLKAEGNEMTNTNPPYLSTKWYMNID